MTLLYKLLKQDPNSREGIISVTSTLGIIVNVLISATKVIIGILASSIAIVSEGANNAADAMSSLIALVGAKLARKHPDKKHPFGYGRIEYLVSLIISVLILVTGIEMLKTSIDLIFNPEEITVSYLSLAILAISAVIKFFLGVYTIKMGKIADSSALVGVGVEGRNDCFASLITILSTLILLISGYSLDAYAGVVVSFFIIKAGYDVIKDTIDDLLGRAGEEELAYELYKLIRETEGIESAADMMLHNYGPDAYTGSVNVEIDQKKTVGEIYNFLHELQLKIMHEYKVVMVFGVYAVDNDNPSSRELRKAIAEFVKLQEHIISYHAVYIDESNKKIYCDFIVDYELKDWDQVREEFSSYLKEIYPDYSLELVVETEFV